MTHYIKAHVPKALREQVWLSIFGKTFENKCSVTWCKNPITAFDFEVGHNIPESKGGQTILENLQPICGRCNKSMGNRMSIDEWNKLAELDPIIVRKQVKIFGCIGKCC